MSTELEGRPAAPGVAVAPAFRLEHVDVVASLEEPSGRSIDPEEERGRLREALETAEQDLRELAGEVAAEAGDEQGEIFEAHAEFAADPELRSRAEDAVAEGASAERAVADAFGSFRELLAASESEYLAARADDLDDVRDRVLAVLTGAEGSAGPTQRSVIVADSLSPSRTAGLPRELIAGIATASGSPTSHAAILARSLGIPAVVAVDGLVELVGRDTEIALDGERGVVIVAPDDEQRRRFTARAEEDAARRDRLAALRDEPARTADGHRIELAANVNDPDRLDAAVEYGAEGSGLVRTEFLFLDREDAPTVDEQATFYRSVLEAMPGHRVVFRTMDVGADKPLPFVDRPAEENPALGVRGIRLSLAAPELFRDQLRALLRARAGVGDDAGRLAIMFPLVSVPEELDAARAVLAEIAAEEEVDLGPVEIGTMVEVPAAALAADRIAERSDFLSVGTNDLLQYLFAADRLAGEVAGLVDPLDPLVLRLLREVIGAAHRQDVWVGVCGEAAAEPAAAAAFVGLGVDELSMTPAAVPEIKGMLREVELPALQAAVEEAMTATDRSASRERVESALPR